MAPTDQAEVAEAPAEVHVEFHRPKLYREQEAAIYDPARYAVIEATVKSGKTSGCLVWISEQAARGRPGRNYWWVAPVFAQAKMAYRRLKASLTAGTFTANDTELKITLAGVETHIWFKSGDEPDSLFGEDVYAAVMDECSRVKEDSWFALRTTLTATRGPVRLIGNVKGRKNWFYRLARRAQAGERDMAYHRITCWQAIAAKILDPREIDDARRMLPETVFKQNYEAEAAEDEGNPFGLEAIRRCVSATSALAKGPAICWGWDFAKSVDWTVGVALNRGGAVCGFERFQRPWKETKDAVRAATQCTALGDATGVGSPIVEDLQRAGVPIEEYVFGPKSKQQLMESLAMAIQQRAISIPADSPIVAELECFEYEYTKTGVRYTAPEGMHDDCVCALALAVWQFLSGAAAPAAAQPVHIGRERDDAWFASAVGRGSGHSIVE